MKEIGKTLNNPIIQSFTMTSVYRIAVAENEHKGIDTARINISVGQEYHEGEKMMALAEWLDRNFSKTIVNVCDTLQRHNHRSMGIDSKNAYRMALAAGNQWIDRNSRTIETIQNAEIIRWNQWLYHPDWKNAEQVIDCLKESDHQFVSILNDTVNAFWERKKNKSESLKSTFEYYSKKYLLEESVCSVLASDKNIVDIYPGTFLPLFSYMRQKQIPTLQNMTRVNFKRRKPQQNQVA